MSAKVPVSVIIDLILQLSLQLVAASTKVKAAHDAGETGIDAAGLADLRAQTAAAHAALDAALAA